MQSTPKQVCFASCFCRLSVFHSWLGRLHPLSFPDLILGVLSIALFLASGGAEP